MKWEVEQLIQWSLRVRDVFFWQDNWTGIGNFDSIFNTNSTYSTKFSSFMEGNQWNVQYLNNFLLPGHINDILLIPMVLMLMTLSYFKLPMMARLITLEFGILSVATNQSLMSLIIYGKMSFLRLTLLCWQNDLSNFL